MKLPLRKFLHLAAGAAALPALSRVTWAQAYPTRPVRIIVGFSAGGPTHRSMAVGASRAGVRRREPTWRRQQYRHRGGREHASGRIYAAHGRGLQRDQRDVVR